MLKVSTTKTTNIPPPPQKITRIGKMQNFSSRFPTPSHQVCLRIAVFECGICPRGKHVNTLCVCVDLLIACCLHCRSCIQTFRRESDRFWVVAAHPTLNVFAAGKQCYYSILLLIKKGVYYNSIYVCLAYFKQALHVQWNPSIAATLGEQHFGPYNRGNLY